MRIKLGSFVIGAALLIGSSAAFAHGVTMKLRHPLPADSAFHQRFVIPWTEKVHQDAGGRISFQIQAGDSAPDKLLDAVREADADVVWTDIAATGGRLSQLEPFELPLLTKDARSASTALADYVRLSDALQAELDGLRVIAAHQAGNPVFHMRERPLTSMDGLEGAKIGAFTSAASLLLVQAGATPVPVPLTKSAASLAGGDVDGVLLSWDLLPAGSQAKHHAETDAMRLDAPVFVLLMNAGTYKGLTDDLKQVIQDNSGAEVAAALVAALEADGQAARKAAAARGDTISTLPAGELEKLQPAAQAAVQEWVKTPGTRGRAQALDTARETLGN